MFFNGIGTVNFRSIESNESPDKTKEEHIDAVRHRISSSFLHGRSVNTSNEFVANKSEMTENSRDVYESVDELNFSNYQLNTEQEKQKARIAIRNVCERVIEDDEALHSAVDEETSRMRHLVRAVHQEADRLLREYES